MDLPVYVVPACSWWLKLPLKWRRANYTSVLERPLELQRAPNSCVLRSGVGVGPLCHLRSPIVFAMLHCSSPWCHLLGNIGFAALHILSVAAQKVAIKCILHPGFRPPPLPPPSPSTSLTNLFLANFRGANFRLTTLRNGVVSSDKPYWWSLQSESLKDCNKFKSENARGTTCYIE